MIKWFIRKYIRQWLEERALVLPAKERERIAKTLKVDPEVIQAIEEAIRNRIIQELGL